MSSTAPASCSSSAVSVGASSSSCSSADSLTCDPLHGVDLLQRRPILPPRLLPLGRVRRRDVQKGGGACLLRDRVDPLDQRLDPRPGGNGLAAVEVDQLAGEPPANRSPHV